MSSSKNIYLLRDFVAGVHLSETHAEPGTLPPTHTVHVYTVYLFTQEWGRERVEPERRLEGQQFTKLGRKYQHDWLHLQSLNSDKHLPQSPFTGQVLFMTTFCFGVYCILYSELVHSVVFPSPKQEREKWGISHY